MFIELIGMMAGILSISAGLPQIIKGIKTKRTKDLSLTSLVMVFLGAVLWLIYGSSIQSFTLIWTNIVSLILNSTLLFIKFKYS